MQANGQVTIKEALGQANAILGSMTFTPDQKENLGKIWTVMDIHANCIKALEDVEAKAEKETKQDEQDDEQWNGGEEDADADSE